MIAAILSLTLLGAALGIVLGVAKKLLRRLKATPSSKN